MIKTANNKTVLGGATYPINVSDTFLNCYATSPITLILPPRSSVTSLYEIGINDILNAFATFNLTLQCSGSDTINGASSLVIAVNGASINIQVSGNTEYVASGLGSGTPTPGSNPLVSKTYAEMAALVGSSELVPGQAYLITDFATKHTIPGTAVINVGVTEPIIVTAETTTTIYCNAISTLYPKDILYYEFVDSTTAGGDKGRIYFRKDTVQLISTWYDWRNVKFRRWQSENITYNTLVGAFDKNETVQGQTTFASGRVVSDNGTTLGLRLIVSSFDIGETLLGGNTGATAVVVSKALTGTYNNFSDTGSGTFQDVYTFGDSATATNFYDVHLGSITDYGISAFGAPTDKLNNITFGTSGQYINIESDGFNSSIGDNNELLKTEEGFNNNVIGDSGSGNTLGKGFALNIIGNNSQRNNISYSCSNNLIGNSFVLNDIGSEMQNNVLGNITNTNKIGSFFQSNSFGQQFDGNVISDSCIGNRVGTLFEKNICANGFSSNNLGNSTYGNVFGIDFVSNTFLTSTQRNIFGASASNNTYGVNFQRNTIGCSFQNNQIGNNASDNILGDKFDTNIIGTTMTFNDIGPLCQLNTIGINFKNNTIGSNCKNNTIGDDSAGNRIGANFGLLGANTIGNNFERNLIGADFANNNIGSSFISNNINDTFQQNTINSGFVLCNVITFIIGVDFSAATIVYGNYSKTITRNNGPANKVVYLDNATNLYVVAAVTA